MSGAAFKIRDPYQKSWKILEGVYYRFCGMRDLSFLAENPAKIPQKNAGFGIDHLQTGKCGILRILPKICAAGLDIILCGIAGFRYPIIGPPLRSVAKSRSNPWSVKPLMGPYYISFLQSLSLWYQKSVKINIRLSILGWVFYGYIVKMHSLTSWPREANFTKLASRV